MRTCQSCGTENSHPFPKNSRGDEVCRSCNRVLSEGSTRPFIGNEIWDSNGNHIIFKRTESDDIWW